MSRVWALFLLACLLASVGAFAFPRPPAGSPDSAPLVVAAQATPLPLGPQIPDPGALLRRAQAWEAEGELEAALRLYAEVARLAPATEAAGRAALGMAHAFLELGQPLSATQVLSPALALLPEGERSRGEFVLADALREAGAYAAAIPFYLRYRERGTSLDDLVAERLASCYRATGAYARAAEAYERAAGSYRTLSDQVWMLEEAAADWRRAGEYGRALDALERILAVARKPWYRAQILYRAGEVLQEAGRADEAYTRWEQVLALYPDTAAASWAADALLAAGRAVEPYVVARAYRAAGRAREAIPWLEEALRQGVAPEAELRTALAEARAEAGDVEQAVAELRKLAAADPRNPAPWLRIAGLWAEVGEMERAAEAYAQTAARFPERPEGGEALWQQGQCLEEIGRAEEALSAYLALLDRFPEHRRATDAAFRAGLLLYRQGAFDRAAALLQGKEGRQALWRGLALARLGRREEAFGAWEEATAAEGYPAARARELLKGVESFGELRGRFILPRPDAGQTEAEAWLGQRLGRPVSSTLSAEVRSDPLFVRGQEWLALGYADEARAPFSLLLERFRYDGPALYALALFLQEEGLYAQSIQAAERLLALLEVKEDDVPPFLLRLVYPAPYAARVARECWWQQLDPLAFLAVVRQESLFDRYATSWAEARGLTQVIPSTGEGIAAQLGYPSFRVEDLYQPAVSLRFGAWYLGRQQAAFGGALFPALAAYNAGPGNARRWAGGTMSVTDRDLFFEAIDFTETRNYVERIYTSYWTYRRLYTVVR
ncbi:MAG: transglycosylase SLT domain-containing protein [Chloroflexia bacterium]